MTLSVRQANCREPGARVASLACRPDSSGYTDAVELWEAPIAASAHNHGILDDDIRHVLRNIIAVADDTHDEDVTLFLGPDRAVELLEVGVLATEEGPVIIHAMDARIHRFRPPKE